MPIKLYCYIDESGQDTQGRLFVVAAVVTDREREQYRDMCEAAERESKRGIEKWSESRTKRKADFIRLILERPLFKGRLFYAVYNNTLEYNQVTAQTIALALQCFGGESETAVVIIDALSRSLQSQTRRYIKQYGAQVEKVRGMKKDENEPLIRLADAVCGLVRDAIDGQADFQEMLDWALRMGVIRDVSPGD